MMGGQRRPRVHGAVRGGRERGRARAAAMPPTSRSRQRRRPGRPARARARGTADVARRADHGRRTSPARSASRRAPCSRRTRSCSTATRCGWSSCAATTASTRSSCATRSGPASGPLGRTRSSAARPARVHRPRRRAGAESCSTRGSPRGAATSPAPTEPDAHLRGVEPGRDFQFERVDVRTVVAGDTIDGAAIRIEPAIEVGNIFKLGTRYSLPLGARYLDETGRSS